MSSPFKNIKVRYSALEKQAFTLVTAINKFKHYILRSKIYVIVPNQSIKLLLMQSELEECQGKWMAILQEFDLYLHLMRLVRGQGLLQDLATNIPHIQY